MSEEMEIKKQLLDRLKEDVDKLEVRKSNLEADIHSLRIQKESAGKIEAAQAMNEANRMKDKFLSDQAGLESKKDQLKVEEEKLRERMREVEKRELFIAEFNQKLAEFDKERRDFQEYKTKKEKELMEVKKEICQLEGLKKEIVVEKDSLKGWRKDLEKREFDIDQRYGILQQEEKEFQLYKSSFPTRGIDVNINKEVVNA